MSKPPPAPPSLEVLRKEIDAIDEQVHRLLMARGDIIDRLISVKQTQEVGSAFRPAREADMMRRLVQRHRGILPLDTVESIWRVIISTFTYVQAPFSVHADISVGESAMRDSARFHFGFTVPYVSHFSAPAAVEAVAKSKGDLALVSATSSRTPWWIALEADGAPKIIARLPFVERADHPAALPVFVVSRVADSAMVTEVEMWSVRVSGWNAEIARALSPLAEIVAVPDTAFDGAALLVSVAGAGQPRKDQDGADRGRRVGAFIGPRRQPRNALYGAPERAGRKPKSRLDNPELKMSRPVPNPGILDIAPYTPGKSPVPEPGRKVFKLSANETPFGPSPKAMEAYKHAAAHLEDYPEGTSRVLREAIGRAFGLDPDRIICGAGSDEILNLLAHTYLSHGDEAISTTHGFLVYPIATMANGAINVVAPETNFTADVDAILKLVSPRTKLVWLANPNNPTGTYLPFDEVKRLRAGLPPHVLLVLDAAYADYVSRNDYETRHRTGGDHRKYRDDAHVLEDPRPRRAADRLDVRPGRYRRCGQPHSRAVQRLDAGDAGGGRRDRGHRASADVEGAHREMAQLADRGDRQARPQGDAERGEFRPDPFPARQGQDLGRGRRLPDQARPGAARAEQLRPAARACA